MFRSINPQKLMDADEYAVFCELDEVVTVYRGVTPYNEENIRALSWTLDNVCGLFETAIQMESRDHREALFRLASELMETQNLLDWIEKTPEEQELPELAES